MPIFFAFKCGRVCVLKELVNSIGAKTQMKAVSRIWKRRASVFLDIKILQPARCQRNQEEKCGRAWSGKKSEGGNGEEWCVSHSVVSHSLPPYGLQPTRLLCLAYSPGKNTGIGCPTGTSPCRDQTCVSCIRWLLYCLSHLGGSGKGGGFRFAQERQVMELSTAGKLYRTNSFCHKFSACMEVSLL